MRLVYGVGNNDGGYVQQIKKTIGHKPDGKIIQEVLWVCPFYRSWLGMLQRSFSVNWKTKYPTYKDTICCDDWLLFSNFKSWMEKQPWKNSYLDKDILFKGNQTYSPECCAFLPQKINALLISCTISQGPYPIGVTKYGNKFLARVQDGLGGRTNLGVFTKSDDAHKAWQLGKANSIETVIDGWREDETYRIDIELSLLARASQLREDARMGIHTTLL